MRFIQHYPYSNKAGLLFSILWLQGAAAQDKIKNIQSDKKVKEWLAKSKAGGNFRQIAMAYKEELYRADKKWNLFYADSMLGAARQSKDDALIGSALLTKGTIYYDRKDQEKALDNFILADKYITKTNDTYLKYKTKYAIAQIKYYLGFYDEAIALLRECMPYFEEENDLAYLNSLHAIGLCYNKVSKYNVASYYYRLGLQKSREYKNEERVPYFNHAEGINCYFKKQYPLAINKLAKVIPALNHKKDFANVALANFYIGKSYWALHRKDKAVSFLIKTDKAFVHYHYIKPELRESYELLIGYYKNKGNPGLQLRYINTLLKVDSILDHNYKYLSKKIYREYDTQKLLHEKVVIEKALTTNKYYYYTVMLLLSGTITGLAIRYHRRQCALKKRFEELMAGKQETVRNRQKDKVYAEPDISPELISVILQNLEKFEKNKKYLEKDMTLVKLANHLKTNTKYASKIILRYRNKKTIEYITDLKTAHIIELLKMEKKYRNYTNKALAEEAGFGSTQNFTRAFNVRVGMSPTSFIEKLKMPPNT